MSIAAHKKNHEHNTISNLDWFGLGLSSLCVLHCIAFSLLAGLAPLLELIDQNGTFHWLIALLIVPTGVFAFWRGYRQHGNKSVLIVGILGLILILMGLFSAVHQPDHVVTVGTILTLIGSALLIFSHYRNWRLNRCQACHPEQS